MHRGFGAPAIRKASVKFLNDLFCMLAAGRARLCHLFSPPVVIFCFYHRFILKVLQFHFPDIIVSLFPLFRFFFSPPSAPTVTPLRRRPGLRFEFFPAEMLHFPFFLIASSVVSVQQATQHRNVPGFSFFFFLHLL